MIELVYGFQEQKTPPASSVLGLNLNLFATRSGIGSLPSPVFLVRFIPPMNFVACAEFSNGRKDGRLSRPMLLFSEEENEACTAGYLFPVRIH